jgi:alkylated DNA repair dioxygenase AlkB
MAIIRGELKNKRARWNLTFGDSAQEPDYAAGRGRIVSFAELPRLAHVRDRLEFFFGKQATGLLAEGNYYYDNKCGIGYHGDGERKIVIAVRLGDTMPLVYQWYMRHASQGKRVDFMLGHGDAYCMSSKAVGTDWMSSSFPTLRHAAGAARFITPKQ